MKKIIFIIIILIPVFSFSQQSSQKKILTEHVLKTVFEEYDNPKFNIYSKDDVLVITCNYQIDISSSELIKKQETLLSMLYTTKQNNFQYFSAFSNRNIFNDILNEYNYILFRTNYITSNLETIRAYYLLSFDDYKNIQQDITEKSFIKILKYVENKN